MDLKHYHVIEDLSSSDTSKQLAVISEIIQQSCLGREITHWLPTIVARGTAQGADPTVRKLTYHVVRQHLIYLAAADRAKLLRAIAVDITKDTVEVAIYALRTVQSLPWDSLHSFLHAHTSAFTGCLQNTNPKVREEAVLALRSFAEGGSRLQISAPELRQAHATAVLSLFEKPLHEALFDPVDSVAAAAFLVALQMLSARDPSRVSHPTPAVVPRVLTALAPLYFRLVKRASEMVARFRLATLRLLSVLSIHVSRSGPKETIASPSTATEFGRTFLAPLLSHSHSPDVVVEAGRCLLFIEAEVRKEQHTPSAGRMGVPSPDTVWQVCEAFLRLVKPLASIGMSYSMYLVRDIANALPSIPDYLQWGCTIKLLNLLKLFRAAAHRPLRIMVFVATFERMLKLTLSRMVEQLQDGEPLSRSLYQDLANMNQHPFWADSFADEGGSVREELIFCLSSAVIDLYHKLPHGDPDFALHLAGWVATGLECMGMCSACFLWSTRAERTGALNQVLRCSMKLAVDGVKVLRERIPPTSPRTGLVDTVKAQHLENQRVLAEIIVNNTLGLGVRTVTKVCLICTVASLLPTLSDVPKELEETVRGLEAKLHSNLTSLCSKYMVDEKETLSLALFDALMQFGARRGGQTWNRTDASIEHVLRDATRSATAPQVLQVVKHKVDNLRKLLKQKKDDGPLALAEIAACGITLFSEYHPALAHDLSPKDLALQLQWESEKLVQQSQASGSPGESGELTSANVITATHDPVQVLAAYIWEGYHVELCLSVTNTTPLTLRNMRVSVGCQGDMVPLCRPTHTAFDSIVPQTEGKASVAVSGRQDIIERLPPGGTVEVVRSFEVVNLTPGMGFNPILDISMNSRLDEGDDEEMEALGDDEDQHGAVCRLHCRSFPLALEHFLVPLPALTSMHIVSVLLHSQQFHTSHPGGDPEAIGKRVEMELFDTPFMNIAPESPGCLHMVHVCGVRSGTNRAPEVLAITVSALVGTTGQVVKGRTAGKQTDAAEAINAGTSSVFLNWTFQASTAGALACVVEHPSFPAFFAQLSDTSGPCPDPPPSTSTPSDPIAEWHALRERHKAAMSAPPQLPTQSHVKSTTGVDWLPTPPSAGLFASTSQAEGPSPAAAPSPLDFFPPTEFAKGATDSAFSTPSPGRACESRVSQETPDNRNKSPQSTAQPASGVGFFEQSMPPTNLFGQPAACDQTSDQPTSAELFSQQPAFPPADLFGQQAPQPQTASVDSDAAIPNEQEEGLGSRRSSAGTSNGKAGEEGAPNDSLFAGGAPDDSLFAGGAPDDSLFGGPPQLPSQQEDNHEIPQCPSPGDPPSFPADGNSLFDRPPESFFDTDSKPPTGNLFFDPTPAPPDDAPQDNIFTQNPDSTPSTPSDTAPPDTTTEPPNKPAEPDSSTFASDPFPSQDAFGSAFPFPADQPSDKMDSAFPDVPAGDEAAFGNPPMDFGEGVGDGNLFSQDPAALFPAVDDAAEDSGTGNIFGQPPPTFDSPSTPTM